MWKHVELFIVDVIADKLVREGREQGIRRELREAGLKMHPQITDHLLNTYSLWVSNHSFVSSVNFDVYLNLTMAV